MDKIWRCLVVVGLLGLSNAAMAGQSGSLVCVGGFYGDGVCDVYELRVTITSDGDAGRPGGFGIGAQLMSGQIAYWTTAGGWGAFAGGLAPPVDGYYPAMPASRNYVVYRGPGKGICELSGGRNFNLFAGYGALMPDKEQTVNELKSRGVTVPADHIRKVFIQLDATKGAGKGGMVYSHDCSVFSSN